MILISTMILQLLNIASVFIALTLLTQLFATVVSIILDLTMSATVALLFRMNQVNF